MTERRDYGSELVDEVARLRAALAEVDRELREGGIEYPLGARGVHDAIMQRDGHLDRAREAETALAEAQEREQRVRGIAKSLSNRERTAEPDGFAIRPSELIFAALDGPQDGAE
jgi:hypothetical protein